jgi:hypothetical protein
VPMPRRRSATLFRLKSGLSAKPLSNAAPNDASRNLDLTPLLRRFLLRCYIIFREES